MATATKSTAKSTEPEAAAPAPSHNVHPNLASALAAFQRHLPRIEKGQRATVPGRDGKTGYQYDYADLTDISSVALPLLAAEGLAWTAPLVTDPQGNINLVYALKHADSEDEITGNLPIGKSGSNWQSLGSAITYARRYALCAVTGIAPGGDDDDAAASVAGAAPESRQAPQQAPVQRNAERLPPGLYDLTAETLRDYDKVRAMYSKAARAGHLALLVGVPNAEGEIEGVPFGQYLETIGTALAPAPDEDPEEAERAAIAAHEAEQDADAQVAREGAGAFPAGPPQADDDAPVGDR